MGGKSSKSSLEISGQNLAYQLQQAKREMAGVGLIFRKSEDGALIVQEIVPGSSAEQCGAIMVGDIMTQVDGTKIAKLPLDDISGMILGNPGEEVRLAFVRPAAGRWRKKYGVALQRTVRASPQPTYHLQRQGDNTVVTMLHLNCLQPENSFDSLSVHPFGLASVPLSGLSTPQPKIMLAAFAETGSSSDCSSRSPAREEDDAECDSVTPPPPQEVPMLAPPSLPTAPQDPPAKRSLFSEELVATPHVDGLQAEEGDVQGAHSESAPGGGRGDAATSDDAECWLLDGVRTGMAKELVMRMEQRLASSPAKSQSSSFGMPVHTVGDHIRQQVGSGGMSCKAEIGADASRLHSRSLLLAAGQE